MMAINTEKRTFFSFVGSTAVTLTNQNKKTKSPLASNLTD